MPNAPVPAAAGGMSKFNRSQIMRDAWAIYRRMTRTAQPNAVAARRKWFANALRSTWEAAKQAAAEAIKTASQRAAERAEEIKRHMHFLDMRPFRHAISNDRKAFVAELAALTAQATLASSMTGERA